MLARAAGGCASRGNEVLRSQEVATVNANIVDGKTTQQEVQSLYGTPLKKHSVVAGFPDTPTAAWPGNPWHVDMARKDAKKLEYLRGLKAVGEKLFERLRGVMN